MYKWLYTFNISISPVEYGWKFQHVIALLIKFYANVAIITDIHAIIRDFIIYFVYKCKKCLNAIIIEMSGYQPPNWQLTIFVLISIPDK